MDLDRLRRGLEAAVPGGVTVNRPISEFTRWKIGGRAAIVVEPRSITELARVIRLTRQEKAPTFVTGDGSNLLFDSMGLDGVLIRIGRRMGEMTASGTRVYAMAGAWVPQVARLAAQRGLTGLEHTSGIPGTLGGLILMNGGSQRKGVGDSVEEITCVDEEGNTVTLGKNECDFSYRKSALQEKNLIICSAVLSLEYGETGRIRREMIDILASRKSRFPKHLPNGGSTFLSDPKMYEVVGPPGKVIEELGLKGTIRGGAQVSPQHANFIVNTGDAKSDDVLYLINKIRNLAYSNTGYLMDCEVRYVSVQGVAQPAHIAAAERFGSTG